jgi:alpha-L-fucosidase
VLVPAANDVASAKLLATGKSLNAKKTPEGIEISLPPAAPDTLASVIKLEVKGKVEAQAAR